MIKDICPGCGKHCYLNEARCERGIEYANTGVMPPRRPRPDGGHGKKHSEEKMKYLALDTEGRIASVPIYMLGQIDMGRWNY